MTASWRMKVMMGKKTEVRMLPTALLASVIRAVAIRILERRMSVMSRTMASSAALPMKNTSQVSRSSRYTLQSCILYYIFKVQ